MPNLKSSAEFAIGQHQIGWIDSDFQAQFGQKEFEPRALGLFQTLTKTMSADEMLTEGIATECELGDVHAFLKNPPEGTKDGLANLFILKGTSYVVFVGWGGEEWNVDAWSRRSGWYRDSRVFSSATPLKSSTPLPSTLDSFDTPNLATLHALVETGINEIVDALDWIADSLEKGKKNKKSK